MELQDPGLITLNYEGVSYVETNFDYVCEAPAWLSYWLPLLPMPNPIGCKFNVPFDFLVGSDVLPDGEYTLERVLAHNDKLFRIHSADNRHQATFLITGLVHTDNVAKARVIFKRHDQRYALTQFWLAGAAGAGVLP